MLVNLNALYSMRFQNLNLRFSLMSGLHELLQPCSLYLRGGCMKITAKVRSMTNIFLCLQRKKVHFMLDVSVHCHSRQTARAKHNIQAHFCFYKRHSTDHSSKQILASICHLNSNISTLVINIQQCENFFCMQQSFPFIFCIQFKAALHENLILS